MKVQGQPPRSAPPGDITGLKTTYQDRGGRGVKNNYESERLKQDYFEYTQRAKERDQISGDRARESIKSKQSAT
jgi:hypothetical protein